jgi:hypothetical protein
MHPWITGRIVETMQDEAKARARHADLGRNVREHERRRQRIGRALASLGHRIAGRRDERPVTGWTTCGATSTSGR